MTILTLAFVKMSNEFFAQHFKSKLCLFIIGQFYFLGGDWCWRPTNIAPLLHLNLDIGVIDYTRGGAGRCRGWGGRHASGLLSWVSW